MVDVLRNMAATLTKLRPPDGQYDDMKVSRRLSAHFLWVLLLISTGAMQDASAQVEAAEESAVRKLTRPGQAEDDYYRLITINATAAATDSRSKRWKPAPEGVALEVSGMQALGDGKLAVAIRKGEVWVLENVYEDPPENVEYRQFAAGLHEPLGLLRAEDGFYVLQRGELTWLRDVNSDGVADEYNCFARGWGVSGNYHEYAYGPIRDRAGKLWITLNTGLGLNAEQRANLQAQGGAPGRQGAWRGWGVQIESDGSLRPISPGMRSPSGLGMNREGDIFFTDQQGNWVPAGSLHHLREHVFYGHPDSLDSLQLPGAPSLDVSHIPANLPYPQAIEQLPVLVPPAVWFPYKKAGQSATDIVCDESEGNFGPFAGQLFVGEFTLSAIHRVFLEKVNGAYQGACFPFREGFASAVIRLEFGEDGSLFAGLSNRGWSSLGYASYGLQRLVWTGRVPFEIQEMRALPDGFELTFTLPVDRDSASDTASYTMSSYTYLYQEKYGSDEILPRACEIREAIVSEDARRVRLVVAGRRPLYVHELIAHGLRSESGRPLLHPQAYYTLNQIPSAARSQGPVPATRGD
jgi:glucose/arabinose dehydrogenase